MDRRCSYAFWLCGAACVVGILLSLCLGAAQLPLRQLWAAICSGPRNTAGYIFWYSRLPRTAACLLAGAALAVSGAVIQSVLQNKLASPGIIGVNAGAGLGVALCCAIGIMSGWMICLSAFGGAMAASLAVLLLTKKTGASRSTVILAGVAINSILNAFRDGITTILPEISALSGEFRVGGFSSVAFTRLIPAGVLIVVALVVSLSMCNDLDVLSLGEDMAGSLGMSVKKTRTLFLTLAALLAGASVSFAGLLGFVGLLVPNLARKFTGSESRRLLPLSALAGAGLVTLCDTVSRILFAPYELPVGIAMSVIGGPVFLFLLLKRRGGHSND